MTEPDTFVVLETDDKLYYVILSTSPDVVKENAIRKAEKLNKILMNYAESNEKEDLPKTRKVVPESVIGDGGEKKSK